jgi:Coenzyme PQQ synthesis protein D (PqqD)
VGDPEQLGSAHRRNAGSTKADWVDMSARVFPDDTRFAPSLHVLIRKVGDELVLLHQGTEMYFGLDRVGASMWEGLSSQVALGELAGSLAERYEATEERIRLDLDQLARKLVEADLLERR